MSGYLSTFDWCKTYHSQNLLRLAKHIIDGAESIGMKPPDIEPNSLNGNYAWEPEDEGT